MSLALFITVTIMLSVSTLVLVSQRGSIPRKVSDVLLTIASLHCYHNQLFVYNISERDGKPPMDEDMEDDMDDFEEVDHVNTVPHHTLGQTAPPLHQ